LALYCLPFYFPPRASAAVSPVCLPLRSASVEPAQYMKKLYEGAFLTPEDKQSPVTPSSTMKSAFTSQGPLGLVTKTAFVVRYPVISGLSAIRERIRVTNLDRRKIANSLIVECEPHGRICMVRRPTARKKLEAKRQVCANVFGLWWSTALLARMSCARICPY
jgi:hypothetical protein